MKISLHFSILLSSQNLYYKCQDKIHPVELKKKNQSRFVSQYENLTLKAPIMTAADDIYKYFFIVFSEKIRLDILCESSARQIRLNISCESSARQRIHMKHQVLFPWIDKSKKIKCCLLQFFFGALRVKVNGYIFRGSNHSFLFDSLLSRGQLE